MDVSWVLHDSFMIASDELLILKTNSMHLISGKFIATTGGTIYNIVYRLVTSTCSLSQIIYEDALYFWSDVSNFVVGVGTTANEGFKNMIDSVVEGCYVAGVGTASILTEGGFKVGTVVDKLKLIIGLILLKLKTLIVLIGGGVWFLVTLIPNFLMTLFDYVLLGAICILDSLKRIAIFLARKAVDLALSVWNYFVDVPLNCLIGLVILYIAYRKRARLRILLIQSSQAFLSISRTCFNIFRSYRIRARRGQVEIPREVSPPPLLAEHHQLVTPSASSGPSPRKPIKQRSSNGSGSPTSLQTCVVCLERKKSVLVMPCKHLCLCKTCSDQLLQYQNHCPMCRKDIAELISVYV